MIPRRNFLQGLLAAGASPLVGRYIVNAPVVAAGQMSGIVADLALPDQKIILPERGEVIVATEMPVRMSRSFSMRMRSFEVSVDHSPLKVHELELGVANYFPGLMSPPKVRIEGEVLWYDPPAMEELREIFEKRVPITVHFTVEEPQ